MAWPPTVEAGSGGVGAVRGIRDPRLVRLGSRRKLVDVALPLAGILVLVLAFGEAGRAGRT